MKRLKKGYLIFGYYTIFVFALLYGIVALLGGYSQILDKPLRVNLGISWAILALISMLTLTYVQLINSLSEHLHKHNYDQKASWRKVFLSWTTGMHFVTILFLTLRITCLSCYPEAYLNPGSKILIFFDWMVLTSFFLGSFMRIHIFFDSYWEDFTKHIRKHL